MLDLIMLKPGKLPPKLLKQLLDQINPTDPSVLLGPQIGEDASVLNTSQSKYLVVTTDPITFATDKIGWYVVNINANDIARTALLMATLPEGTNMLDATVLPIKQEFIGRG